ncbi:MAG: CRISPR-associated endonuclease Cas1 [Kiritimatiellae bacterium]|nr:CRISPR-associated endonuclease Cas1 [Kiritimatiellia bacterium]
MEQVFDIGEYGDRVRLDGGRIVVWRTDGSQIAMPVRDVAVLMLSEAGVSVSAAVMAELAKAGATAVVCDRTHMPVGIFQPIAVHTRQTGILLRQIAVRPVLRARRIALSVTG